MKAFEILNPFYFESFFVERTFKAHNNKRKLCWYYIIVWRKERTMCRGLLLEK